MYEEVNDCLLLSIVLLSGSILLFLTSKSSRRLFANIFSDDGKYSKTCSGVTPTRGATTASAIVLLVELKSAFMSEPGAVGSMIGLTEGLSNILNAFDVEVTGLGDWGGGVCSGGIVGKVLGPSKKLNGSESDVLDI